MLNVEGLDRRFGSFQALDQLTMTIPQGAIYGFIGRNGAGKTTLIKIVSDLMKADGGKVTLGGGGPRPSMGVIAGAPAMYDDMTAEENMRQQYRVLGLSSFDGAREKLRAVGLEGTGRKKAKHFSQGMRQKLGVAMALAGDPAFVILDEPVNGLDPQGIIGLRTLIQRLNRERGVTFLLSSHILDELSRVATHYGFIDRGHMVRQMTAEELERERRRPTRVRVSDAGALAVALDGMGARYQALSPTEADVFTPVSVTGLAAALSGKGCEIYACEEREESLEDYFVRLVGGEKDA